MPVIHNLGNATIITILRITTQSLQNPLRVTPAQALKLPQVSIMYCLHCSHLETIKSLIEAERGRRKYLDHGGHPDKLESSLQKGLNPEHSLKSRASEFRR